MIVLELDKKCCKCKERKDISNFGKNASRRDGLQDECKSCKRISSAKYQSSAKGKEANRRYSMTDKFTVAQNKYKQSEKGRLQQALYRKNNKESLKAREVVNTLIRSGKLERPDTLMCTNCEERAHDYHHTNGYKLDNYLDIIPVCTKCHTAIHIGL